MGDIVWGILTNQQITDKLLADSGQTKLAQQLAARHAISAGAPQQYIGQAINDLNALLVQNIQPYSNAVVARVNALVHLSVAERNKKIYDDVLGYMRESLKDFLVQHDALGRAFDITLNAIGLATGRKVRKDYGGPSVSKSSAPKKRRTRRKRTKKSKK